MASIKDISKETGFSLATVSRVFNNSPLVSSKTRRKVLKAAADLNYRPNRAAASLRSGKTFIVGVIVPEINNYFFGNVINGLEEKLAEKNYNTVIFQSHESSEIEKQALDSLMKINVDGILISVAKNTEDFSVFKSLQKEGVPIVFFDRMPALENVNSVVLDDFKGARIATKHLIKNGCKHLVHIAGENTVSIFKKRREGFLDVVKANQNVLEKHHIINLSYDLTEDKKLLKKLLEENPTIDGIFAHGDKYAVHTLNILRLLDYQVPEKIKVVGFGNNDYTEFTYPKMSSIDQKCHEMGTLTAQMLLDNVGKKDIIYSQQVLLPKLIERKSSLQT